AVLTLTGCVAGAGLVARLAGRAHMWLWAEPLPLFSLLQLGLLIVSPYCFDRYLIVLIPGAASVAMWHMVGWRARASVGLVCLFGLAALAWTRDFLSWNRALWDLGRRAVVRGIDPQDIEGGFAWDVWHAPRAAADKRLRPRLGLALRFTR